MKSYKYIIALILLLSCGFSQSSITIEGTGTGSTSAHITVTTNAYKCADEYIVQDGSTLTTWGVHATCSGCENGSIIYNTETGKFNFCEDGVWVEK